MFARLASFINDYYILSYIFLSKKETTFFGYPILSSIKYTRWIFNIDAFKTKFRRRNIALISRDLMSIFSRHPIYFINPYETTQLARKKEIIRSVIRGLCINLAAYCRSLFPRLHYLWSLYLEFYLKNCRRITRRKKR